MRVTCLLLLALFSITYFSCIQESKYPPNTFLEIPFERAASGDSIIGQIYYLYIDKSIQEYIINGDMQKFENFLLFLLCEHIDKELWNKHIYFVNSLRPFNGFYHFHDDVDYEELNASTLFSLHVSYDSSKVEFKIFKANDKIFSFKNVSQLKNVSFLCDKESKNTIFRRLEVE